MTFRTYIGFVLITLILLVPQTPSGPTVELRLIVTDKNRKAVNSINKDEIRIIEDKVEQTVLSVEGDTRPIDYGLLIDSSKSLNRLLVGAVVAAKLIATNRRGSDEIFIQSFTSSDKIQTIHKFSTDTNALLESLKLIKIEDGQSAIIDALYLAAEHVAEHNKTAANRRKAIVIITDGEDRDSFYKLDALVTLLREKGIQVFALGLVIDVDSEGGLMGKSPRKKAEKLLNTITEETGGRVFYPKTSPELINATAEIITDLRSQFRVTYQSSHSGKTGFRKVDVKLISPNERKAIAPRGYYVDGPSKSKEQKSK